MSELVSQLLIHSFIHSDNFYSASSSPLLLRGTPDTARSHTVRGISQVTVSEGLAQGPYVADRAGIEPMTLRMKGVDSANASHTPHIVALYCSIISLTACQFILFTCNKNRTRLNYSINSFVTEF